MQTGQGNDKTVSVELEPDFARVILAIKAWIDDLKHGGFGEILLEVRDHKVTRVRPTESWMASML